MLVLVLPQARSRRTGRLKDSRNFKSHKKTNPEASDQMILKPHMPFYREIFAIPGFLQSPVITFGCQRIEDRRDWRELRTLGAGGRDAPQSVGRRLADVHRLHRGPGLGRQLGQRRRIQRTPHGFRHGSRREKNGSGGSRTMVTTETIGKAVELSEYFEGTIARHRCGPSAKRCAH
jgi:hypothetical protein